MAPKKEKKWRMQQYSRLMTMPGVLRRSLKLRERKKAKGEVVEKEENEKQIGVAAYSDR